MSFFDKLNKSEGGYIFLSHSHDDLEIVRKIRNRLEEDGFEPLCFYLKCLSDDSEIEDLIKREIDAREWFVFVNSENARKSKWVTLEREYITRTDSKKIITIDIDDPDMISKAIDGIARNLRVFISYASRDMEIARRIRNKLAEKDYLVFFAPDSIPAGEDYISVVTTAIQEASQDGCVLALLSEAALKSAYMTKEIAYAAANNGNILPVMLGDVQLPMNLQFYLADKQIYRLSEAPDDRELENMIDTIGRTLVQQSHR